MKNKNNNRKGFVFKPYEAPSQSPFEKLFDIFKELITHTSGDFDEAMDWLKELDKEYKLTNPDYTLDDFVEELKERGYLKEEIEPEKPISGSAFERRHNIPKYLPDALKRLKISDTLIDLLGKDFITLYTEIKQTEHDAYQNVISAWEREHLLLKV